MDETAELTQPIFVNITFDDFLYNEVSDFCNKNDIEIGIFIKKLIVRYLNSMDGFRIIK